MTQALKIEEETFLWAVLFWDYVGTTPSSRQTAHLLIDKRLLLVTAQDVNINDVLLGWAAMLAPFELASMAPGRK